HVVAQTPRRSAADAADVIVGGAEFGNGGARPGARAAAVERKCEAVDAKQVQAAADVEAGGAGVVVGLIDVISRCADGDGVGFDDVVIQTDRAGGEIILAPADVSDVGAAEIEGPGVFVESFFCGSGGGDVGE